MPLRSIERNLSPQEIAEECQARLAHYLDQIGVNEPSYKFPAIRIELRKRSLVVKHDLGETEFPGDPRGLVAAKQFADALTTLVFGTDQILVRFWADDAEMARFASDPKNGSGYYGGAFMSQVPAVGDLVPWGGMLNHKQPSLQVVALSQKENPLVLARVTGRYWQRYNLANVFIGRPEHKTDLVERLKQNV